MNDFFHKTFLALTANTIPYGYEDTLVSLLPSGIQKDSCGNYFLSIGHSTTLFTTHLDTYCKEYLPVNHVIDGDIIRTDGTTILGGDNKLGCTILLYLIQQEVPGLYYFFISEEPISPKGGRWGSQQALAQYESLFKTYQRCIAFDRKQTGSLVTRQLGRNCCSPDFVTALIGEFQKGGISYQADHQAYYTDTATFLDTIPECTNLSAGGWHEHYTNEYVDLSYTRAVAQAAAQVDWESLPTARSLADFSQPKVNKYQAAVSLLKKVETLLHNKYDLLWTNKKHYQVGLDDFMEFNHWFDDLHLRIILSTTITCELNGKSHSCTGLKDLDLHLNDLLGVPLDYSPLGLDQEGYLHIEVAGKVVKMGWESYLALFQKANPLPNTTYVAPGYEQFKDYGGEVITRAQFYKWLRQNDIIE